MTIDAPTVLDRNERTNRWLRRLAMTAAVYLCLLMTGLGIAGVAVVVRLGSVVDQVKAQAIDNQHHTDCDLAFALQNPPDQVPKCADVAAQLERDGVRLTSPAAATDPRRLPAVTVIVCAAAAMLEAIPPDGFTCPPVLPQPTP